MPELDEYGIIDAIVRSSGKLPRGYSQIGDDVSFMPLRRGGLVVKCDMLVSSTDVPEQMSYMQASRKSVAMCVSDFAAKGVRPDSFLLSLGIPRSFPESGVVQLSQGFRDAGTEWDLKLLGGDTNEAKELVIDCTMLGFSERIVSRSGAAPGQYIVVSGHFGYPPSGLMILRGAHAAPAFRRRAVQSVLEPKPKLELGLALSRYLTASIDSSDGLAICLHTLASMSGVGVVVKDIPCRDELVRFAEDSGASFEELVLNGGEEYEIVGTIEKRKIAGASRVARSMGSELLVIGETTPEKGRVEMVDGRRIEKKGWVHLSGT